MRHAAFFRLTALLLGLLVAGVPPAAGAGVTNLESAVRDTAIERAGTQVAPSCAGGSCGAGSVLSAPGGLLSPSCGAGGCGGVGGFLQGILGFFKQLFSGIVGFFQNLFGGGGNSGGGDCGGGTTSTGGGDTSTPSGGTTSTGGGDTSTPGGDTTSTGGGETSTPGDGTTPPPGGETTSTGGGSTVVPPAGMAELEKQAGLIPYGKTQNYSSAKSAMQNDVESHIATKHRGQYRDSDPGTWTHETTHGINSDIRNGVARQNLGGYKVNGFYLGDGKAYIMKEFNLRKRDAVPFIPASLRSSRYNMYILGQAAWDDTPSYIFDEWVAYTNGGVTSVELGRQGLLRQHSDAVKGSLEFTLYSLGLAMAVERKDPGRFDAQFKAFMALQMRRAMSVFHEGQKIQNLTGFGQQELLQKFLTGPDAEAMRAFVKRHWGDAFFKEVFEAR